MESTSGAAEGAGVRERDREKLLGERPRGRTGGVVCDLLLRILALLLTLGALLVIASNEQPQTVFYTLAPGIPGFITRITVYFHDFPSLTYFLVANGVAVLYSILSVVVSLINRGGMKGLTMLLIVLDLAVMAALFSSLGAALDVGLIAYNGLQRAQWWKICNVFQRFCNMGAAAVALSAGASLIFFFLVVLGAATLYKRIL